MKWIVAKVPEGDSNVSKSARFFDDVEEAIMYQMEGPYNTVLAHVEDYKPSIWERFFEWLNGKPNPPIL